MSGGWGDGGAGVNSKADPTEGTVRDVEETRR